MTRQVKFFFFLQTFTGASYIQKHSIFKWRKNGMTNRSVGMTTGLCLVLITTDLIYEAQEPLSDTEVGQIWVNVLFFSIVIYVSFYFCERHLYFLCSRERPRVVYTLVRYLTLYEFSDPRQPWIWWSFSSQQYKFQHVRRLCKTRSDKGSALFWELTTDYWLSRLLPNWLLTTGHWLLTILPTAN
jgi:hypothetical protein